ncbi:MAG: hypothetical protein AB7N76_34685 [Planctomycetota bacterium]
MREPRLRLVLVLVLSLLAAGCPRRSSPPSQGGFGSGGGGGLGGESGEGASSGDGAASGGGGGGSSSGDGSRGGRGPDRSDEGAGSAASAQESPVTNANPDPSTREELLAYEPAQAFAHGLRGEGPKGLAKGLLGTAPAALAEQMKHEKTPPQALDLVLVVFQRAQDTQGNRSILDGEVLDRLRRDLTVQTSGHAALGRWASALVGKVESPPDLRAASTFLEHVRAIAHLGKAARKADKQQKSDPR